MCGIVGYVGNEACAGILLDGLRRLEYRGYDSAGLAVIDDGRIDVLRAVGKLAQLQAALQERPLPGVCGIGHTRWATHGKPSEPNAHPHCVGAIALVHNGIIENHRALREQLESEGRRFLSDTDTEIAAHLVAREVDRGLPLVAAVRAALRRVEGTYAVAVLSEHEADRIVVSKHESPLVVGLTDNACLCGSDIPALLPYTRDMVFLEDGDVAILEKGGVTITDAEGKAVERAAQSINWSPIMAEKAGYKHFMLKEIFEQPRALEDTLRGRLDREGGGIRSEELGLADFDPTAVNRVVLLACGTSHHAALAGRYYMERLAGIQSTVELASEFRGRDAVVGEGDLVVAISQSGETLDTLAAARMAKERGARVLTITNVIGSAMARLAHGTFYTHAGPEIGVASTKCFTTQLAGLLMLSLHLGGSRGTLKADDVGKLVEAMAKIPHLVTQVLQSTRQLVASLARRHRNAQDVLYLGRGLSFPIALEGALKLKEISYIHAEGYAAGEMKHGPIALIDEGLPVLVLAPHDTNYARTLSNLEEAKARGAHVIAVGFEDDEALQEAADETIEVPRVPEELTPFVTVLPLQLFAYYVADLKGTDVDQPRNLAKTVTVE